MEEFEVEVIDKEPRFLEGQTGRSGVQMEPIRVLREEDGTLNRNHDIYIYYSWLVVSAPLKNISSSVGMINYSQHMDKLTMFQTTKQIG